MKTVAKDKNELKRRIKRFFNESSKERQEIHAFLDKLSELSTIYIFGGAIRDIALQGILACNSDIDIIYEGNSKCVREYLAHFSPTRNKFGGYRFTLNRRPIDIWEARESWAFKEGHKKYSGIESLLTTTITNWDSVLFDWKNKIIIVRKQYFADLADGYLEIILDKNPNRMGMYVRLLRFYADKNARLLSPKAASLLRDAMHDYSFEEIRDYELNGYGESHISYSLYSYLKSHQSIEFPDLLPVELDSFNCTKPLV